MSNQASDLKVRVGVHGTACAFLPDTACGHRSAEAWLLFMSPLAALRYVDIYRHCCPSQPGTAADNVVSPAGRRIKILVIMTSPAVDLRGPSGFQTQNKAGLQPGPGGPSGSQPSGSTLSSLAASGHGRAWLFISSRGRGPRGWVGV